MEGQFSNFQILINILCKTFGFTYISKRSIYRLYDGHLYR